MTFQSISNKIYSLSGKAARKVIYNYLHELNKGTRRGTRKYTTQLLTDCGTRTEYIEVYKMEKNEAKGHLIYTFKYQD